MRPIPERCGKKMNSGSTFPGTSIRKESLECENILNHRIEAGRKLRVDEYYRWIFENSVPGLPEKAAKEGLDPAGIHAEIWRI